MNRSSVQYPAATKVHHHAYTKPPTLSSCMSAAGTVTEGTSMPCLIGRSLNLAQQISESAREFISPLECNTTRKIRRLQPCETCKILVLTMPAISSPLAARLYLRKMPSALLTDHCALERGKRSLLMPSRLPCHLRCNVALFNCETNKLSTCIVQHSYNRVVPAENFACAFPQATVQNIVTCGPYHEQNNTT